MDVAVFRPLKLSWKNQVKSWKTENPKQVMKRKHFASNFEAALRNLETDTIKNGFRKSGIFPFGPEYVDMNKIILIIIKQNRYLPSQNQPQASGDFFTVF